MATQNAKPDRRCVFCGGTGLSKEHVISDWLKAYLPKFGSHEQLQTSLRLDYASKTASITPRFSERQGDHHGRKVRTVCKRCNSGWMSGIVNRAKPAVISIVHDVATSFHVKSLRDLSAWIALMTTMGEYTDANSARITAEERKSIWLYEEPPDNWTICLGRYSGSEWSKGGSRYAHHSAHFAHPLNPGPVEINSSKLYYMQVTTVAIKSMFVHCFSSNSPREVAAYRRWWLPATMTVIWPLRTADLEWPSTPILTDADAEEIADAYYLSLIRRSTH